MCVYDYSDLDSMLPFLTFAYNLPRHATACFSLFYLRFSRHPSVGFETLLPLSTNNSTEHAQDVFARAHTARPIAGSWLTESQAA